MKKAIVVAPLLLRFGTHGLRSGVERRDRSDRLV